MFGNLYKIAASVIPQQTVEWLRFEARVQDERGRWINNYSEPEEIRCSFQPVDTKDVKRMGFDESKSYKVLFTDANLQNVQRGESPDRVIYAGATYDVVGAGNDWIEQDGWKSIHCVKVEPL